MRDFPSPHRQFLIFLILACSLANGVGQAAVSGRYVRVEIPPRTSFLPDTKRLGLYELEVYRGLTNVAPRGKLSVSGGQNFGLVVDGDLNTKTQTPPELNPWLEIDFGEEESLDRIVLRPVPGERPEIGVLFSILDAERRVVWYQRHPWIQPFPTASRPQIECVPESLTGRYVGQAISRDTTAWYDTTGEEPRERRIALESVAFPPVTAVQRRQTQFEQRESAVEIEKLCRKFYALVDPETPGLEAFKACFDRGEYQAALDAYRDGFFSRPAHRRFTLQPPLLMGIHSTFIETQTSEFSPVEPATLELLMRGERLWKKPGGLAVSALGFPGSTRWTPPESASAESPSEAELNLFRRASHQHGPHFFLYDELLFAYAATGRKEYLTRWLDYLDDWCLFGREDVLNSTGNLTMASEWTTKTVGGRLRMLEEIASKRPELAKDFRSSTFVRQLMSLVEDLPPYTIRARRAQLANWGCGGTEALAYLGALLPEFRCMRYFSREAIRLAMSNYIQNRMLDGELIEAWDGGHRASDLFMMTVFDLLPQLPTPVPRSDELQMRYLRDLKNVFYRNVLTDVSPEGYYRAQWLTNTARASDRASDYAAPRKLLEEQWLHLGRWGSAEPWEWLQANDPQAAARAKLILGHPEAVAPSRISDCLPYGGIYWLRDQWRDGAECLVLRNNRTRTQDVLPFGLEGFNSIFGAGAQRYDVLKDGRSLLHAEGIVIDGKPSNPWHNAIPTGGKTEFSGVAEHNVQPERFHTSSRFDFAEATRRYPYSRPLKKWFHGVDWYGVWVPQPTIDNTPLTGVTAQRQVFHVRGSGVWIVADRIQNPNPKRCDYAQFWTFPALLKTEGYAAEVQRLAEHSYPLVEESAARRCIRTASPGLANISTYFFGHEFELVREIDQTGRYAATESSQPALTILRDSGDKAPTFKRSLRKSGVRWQGTGDQAFVTLHTLRDALDGSGQPFENDLREVQELTVGSGITGFRAVTHKGLPIWFQSGAGSRNGLEAGPARAVGETLLAMEENGCVSGLALGTDKCISLRGQRYGAETADFEYTLSASGEFVSRPIHRAIDTVEIQPAQNVFTESVQVSFRIPSGDAGDLEFRYTLDGSDPTLDSPMYTTPLSITTDTYVKVRPFRKGLGETPFNVPSEEAGKTVGAIFRKQSPAPPVTHERRPAPGLAYEYFEGTWPSLFTHVGERGVLEPKRTGDVQELLAAADVQALRSTAKAYALKYEGYVEVPETGVYGFHAPEHLYTPTMDAGYDLRVWIDGEEWFPSPTLHSQNVWHVALSKGSHRLRITFVDYRWQNFKDEYWMSWFEQQIWKGIPVLEVSGPHLSKRPLPAAWLFRDQ